MNIDREIFKVLAEVGPEGLSVQKISIHVHNACNTFFNYISYEEVHSYVTQYLIRQSKIQSSPIERTGFRGIYRLKTDDETTRQLMLQFDECNSVESQEGSVEDKELPLPLF